MTFQQAVRSRDFVLTAQLPLRPTTTAEDLREMIDVLRPHVDAVQIGDNNDTQPHIAPIAAASIALGCDMDPVVHMSCRDRNRIALQSDLMGAAAIGVTSFLLSRGEKLPATLKQRVKGVFDIGAKRLLATAQVIAANERMVRSPGLFLGANVTVIDPPADWSAAGIETKVEAGTKFLQTQPCLDLATLRNYMAALVARKALQKTSVIVQVPLLDSPETARELQAGARSLLIPDATAQRLQDARDFAAEAEAVALEVLRELPSVPGVAGANLLYRGETSDAARVLSAVEREHA